MYGPLGPVTWLSADKLAALGFDLPLPGWSSQLQNMTRVPASARY